MVTISISPNKDDVNGTIPPLCFELRATIASRFRFGVFRTVVAIYAQYVDRKPEYIGEDIRLCHRKTESSEKIDRILAALKDGRRKTFYFEAERNGHKLG